MKRLILGLLASVVLLTGCAASPAPGDYDGTVPAEGAGGSSTDESAAVGLVNLWRVSDAAGEGADTWLRIDGSEIVLWRDCGVSFGSWKSSGDLLVASLSATSGEGCLTDFAPLDAPWLTATVGFEANGATGYSLVDAAGETVATLAVDGAPPTSPDLAAFYSEAPEITDEVREQLSSAVVLPAGATVPTPSDLEGKWIADVPAVDQPFAEFTADGTVAGAWTGSDGCNGGGGRWVLGDGGTFVASSGPSTLMYCEGAAVPSWVSSASTVGMVGDELVFFDKAGTVLGELQRA